VHVLRDFHPADHPAGDAGVVTTSGVAHHKHLLLQAEASMRVGNVAGRAFSPAIVSSNVELGCQSHA
jgi:hypothetical protein